MVTIATSKPISATAGNSTEAVMVSITDTKCSARARRAIGGKSRKMVVDVVDLEPVSVCEFPANREKNREFCSF